MASIALGESILPPPDQFDLIALVTAIAIHFIISILYALLIAFIIHRGGLITGLLGGALLGLGLYAIQFHAFTYFFSWLLALRGGLMVLTHVIYGAVAGGVYEALEVEVFVPVQQPDNSKEVKNETT